MDISIIIPVYNGEETLELCLSAVTKLENKSGKLEILVINDGSTDNSAKIISGYNNIIQHNLSENKGRLSARKIGAEKAKYDNLLFIDSRIIVKDTDLIERIEKIDYQPLMVGDLNIEKYTSDYDTIFYLIRKQIYKPYFPQTNYNKELLITKLNFKKAPKGFGLFFISKDLFFKIQPNSDIDDKSVSDDTLLLYNMVFKCNKNIIRHTDLRVKYLQRTNSNIFEWILHRGKLWADFYLKSWNKYSITYIILHIIGIKLLLTNFINLIILIIILFVGGSFYLSENKKDFKILLSLMPKLLYKFYIGTILKLYQRFIG